jgi:RimJ/RimL family protein N-acetyltransferase
VWWSRNTVAFERRYYERMMSFEPVVLRGKIVRLEPLTIEHVGPLVTAGLHDELWRWTTTRIRTESEMRDYVETALRWQAEGSALPFVTIGNETGEVIGSTRFANIDRENRRAEIGWTWVMPAWQRSGANVEAKYLMLEHAFERLGCNRVEFKTDSLNEKSRRALLGIGAIEEGILRNHMVVWDGRLRHSVYFSVIRSEWPHVKERLLARMARAESGQSVGRVSSS